jgi:uncharacterized cupin superfamily protein
MAAGYAKKEGGEVFTHIWQCTVGTHQKQVKSAL